MVWKYLMTLVVLAGTAWAETDVSNALNSLPPELKGKLNESDVENIKNQSTALFKEKCEKVGGAAAYQSAQKAYDVFPTCVKESLGLSDPAVLQREIEQAKPNGTVDEVFKKYCAKTPEVMQCLKDMMDSIKPCFNGDEQKNLKTVTNITEQLAEFICFKDGDRIALFIAEGGPECFQEKQEHVQECANQAFGNEYKVNTDNITANTIPEINFGEKECAKFDELQSCVVKALESCKAPTSANIVESLFKFARKATPCNKRAIEAKPRSQVNVADNAPGAANALAVSSTIFSVVALVTAMS